MQNLSKRYQLSIFADGVPNVLLLPVITDLTLEFKVTRSAMYSLNTGHFKIYNISRDSAPLIAKDRFIATTYNRAVLQVQIGDQPYYTIFDGNIHEAYSYHDGVDFITEISCMQGGYDAQNAQISQTVTAGTPIADIFQLLANQFQYTEIGSVDPEVLATPPETRDTTLVGSVYKKMNALFGNSVFFDNGFINLVGDGCGIIVGDSIPSISYKDGLIGTPRRRGQQMNVEAILMPHLAAAQLVKVESLNLLYNGEYKIQSLTHSGILSKSVAAETTTSLELFAGLEGVPFRVAGGL